MSNKKYIYVSSVVLLIIVVVLWRLYFISNTNNLNQNNKQDNKQNNKNTSVLDTISASWGPIAKNYIQSKYPDYKVIQFANDPMCTGEQAIDIAIEKVNMKNTQGDNKLSLIFLTNGDFVQSEINIDIGKAPTIVTDTIKNKYKNYKAGNQLELLVLKNGETQYLADLTENNKTIEVIMDNAGMIKCVK